MFWNISGLPDICCMRDCMAGVWNMLLMGLPDCWGLAVGPLLPLKTNDQIINLCMTWKSEISQIHIRDFVIANT